MTKWQSVEAGGTEDGNVKPVKKKSVVVVPDEDSAEYQQEAMRRRTDLLVAAAALDAAAPAAAPSEQREDVGSGAVVAMHGMNGTADSEEATVMEEQ